ncbi:hypothetical protein B6V74_06330 [Thioclava sp. F42-5]|nr:hypothetical protein B6V74_06330 [Thioclava sp. F42-5]
MEGAMAYEVEIRTLPPVRLVGLAHTGPYPAVAPVFQRLVSLIPEPSWTEVEHPAMIGHDNPRTVPAEDLRSHACFIVGEGFVIFPPLEEIRYPAGRYATLTIAGPYDQLPEAYRWLAQEWYPASGEAPRGLDRYEVYLNDPFEPKPGNLLTEIRLPLKD